MYTSSDLLDLDFFALIFSDFFIDFFQVAHKFKLFSTMNRLSFKKIQAFFKRTIPYISVLIG